MAQIQPVIEIKLDPLKPVPEICAVISAVMPYHPDQEKAILNGITEAINHRLNQLKGAEKQDAKPIRESSRIE